MGVIYMPESEPEPQRPGVDPRDYPAGTIWESPDGSRWVSDWSAARGFQWVPDRTSGDPLDCPGCGYDPMAPHNGKGDCAPNRTIGPNGPTMPPRVFETSRTNRTAPDRTNGGDR